MNSKNGKIDLRQIGKYIFIFFKSLYNLINLKLWLVRNEPISMANIFIRYSSPGLFAGGIKKIRRVYCIGSLGLFFESFFEPSFFSLYNLVNLELCLVRYEPISMIIMISANFFSGIFHRQIRRFPHRVFGCSQLMLLLTLFCFLPH